MNIDFTTMADNELAKFVNKAKEEIERRGRVQKEECWNKVRDAIKDYTTRYGDIIVDSGDFYIDSSVNFECIGEIQGCYS